MKNLVPTAALRRVVVSPVLLCPILIWSLGCGGQMIEPSGATSGSPSSSTGGSSGGNPQGNAGPGIGIPGSATGGAASGSGTGGAPSTSSGSGTGGVPSAGSATGGASGPSPGTGGAGPVASGGGLGGRGAGSPGSAGSGSGTTSAGAGLPCDVQTLLANRCQTCHGTTPIGGAPSTLVTYQDLTSPSKSDPTKTEAEVAVSRMQNTTLPMPPKPGTPATAAEVATIAAWITAGYPTGSCGGPATGGGADGGVGDAGSSGGGTVPPAGDVFAAAPVCTSKVTSRGGEGPTMDPGQACVACHSRGEGPSFAIAGTVYPTAHEPDNCSGTNGSTGVQVVITGADGKSLTLTPNTVGNFSSSGAVAKPYQAKLVYQGRERLMVAAQTSGDCNSCHTQSGANAAPGRLVLP